MGASGRANRQHLATEKKKRQVAALIRKGYTRREAKKIVEWQWQPRRVEADRGAADVVGAIVAQGFKYLEKGDPGNFHDICRAKDFMRFLNTRMSHTWHDIVDIDPSYTIKKAKQLYSKYV